MMELNSNVMPKLDLKKRPVILPLLILVIMGLMVWLTGGFHREPLHKGKPITYWVDRACTSEDPRFSRELVVIGPAVVPYLVSRLVVRAVIRLSWTGLIAFAEQYHLDLLPAVPALREMQNSESPEIRKLVSQALETIERIENKEQVRTSQ